MFYFILFVVFFSSLTIVTPTMNKINLQLVWLGENKNKTENKNNLISINARV